MRSLTSLLALLAALSVAVSCTRQAAQPYQRTGMVVCEAFTDEVITVSSTISAADASTAIYRAERQAFENLLFKGIPECSQKRPLVADERAALDAHGAYFTELLDGDGLRRFVTRSASTDSQALRGGGNRIVQTIEIDLNGLRRDLERAGVVRKFGL